MMRLTLIIRPLEWALIPYREDHDNPLKRVRTYGWLCFQIISVQRIP